MTRTLQTRGLYFAFVLILLFGASAPAPYWVDEFLPNDQGTQQSDLIEEVKKVHLFPEPWNNYRFDMWGYRLKRDTGLESSSSPPTEQPQSVSTQTQEPESVPEINGETEGFNETENGAPESSTPHPRTPTETLDKVKKYVQKIVQELSQFNQRFVLRLIRMTAREDLAQMPELMNDFDISPERPIFFIAGGLKSRPPEETTTTTTTTSTTTTPTPTTTTTTVTTTTTATTETPPTTANPSTTEISDTASTTTATSSTDNLVPSSSSTTEIQSSSTEVTLSSSPAPEFLPLQEIREESEADIHTETKAVPIPPPHLEHSISENETRLSVTEAESSDDNESENTTFSSDIGDPASTNSTSTTTAVSEIERVGNETQAIVNTSTTSGPIIPERRRRSTAARDNHGFPIPGRMARTENPFEDEDDFLAEHVLGIRAIAHSSPSHIQNSHTSQLERIVDPLLLDPDNPEKKSPPPDPFPEPVGPVMVSTGTSSIVVDDHIKESEPTTGGDLISVLVQKGASSGLEIVPELEVEDPDSAPVVSNASSDRIQESNLQNTAANVDNHNLTVESLEIPSGPSEVQSQFAEEMDTHEVLPSAPVDLNVAVSEIVGTVGTTVTDHFGEKEEFKVASGTSSLEAVNINAGADEISAEGNPQIPVDEAETLGEVEVGESETLVKENPQIPLGETETSIEVNPEISVGEAETLGEVEVGETSVKENSQIAVSEAETLAEGNSEIAVDEAETLGEDNPQIALVNNPAFESFSSGITDAITATMSEATSSENVQTGEATFLQQSGSPQLFPDVPQHPPEALALLDIIPPSAQSSEVAPSSLEGDPLTEVTQPLSVPLLPEEFRPSPYIAPLFPEIAPPSDVAPPLPDIAPPSDIAPPLPDLAPPADVAPPLPDLAPPSDVAPPLPDIAPPSDVAPPLPDIAPPSDIAPPLPDLAPPADVAPPLPEIAPSSDIAPPLPDLAPPADVALPLPEIAPPSDVATPLPEIAPPSDIAAPLPDLAPPADVALPLPEIAPPSDVAPPLPEIAPPSDIAPPLPDLAPPADVALPLPEIAPPSDVATPLPEIAPPSDIAAPLPDLAPPSDVSPPLPDFVPPPFYVVSPSSSDPALHGGPHTVWSPATALHEPSSLTPQTDVSIPASTVSSPATEHLVVDSSDLGLAQPDIGQVSGIGNSNLQSGCSESLGTPPNNSEQDPVSSTVTPKPMMSQVASNPGIFSHPTLHNPNQVPVSSFVMNSVAHPVTPELLQTEVVQYVQGSMTHPEIPNKPFLIIVKGPTPSSPVPNPSTLHDLIHTFFPDLERKFQH